MIFKNLFTKILFFIHFSAITDMLRSSQQMRFQSVLFQGEQGMVLVCDVKKKNKMKDSQQNNTRIARDTAVKIFYLSTPQHSFNTFYEIGTAAVALLRLSLLSLYLFKLCSHDSYYNLSMIIIVFFLTMCDLICPSMKQNIT